MPAFSGRGATMLRLLCFRRLRFGRFSCRRFFVGRCCFLGVLLLMASPRACTCREQRDRGDGEKARQRT
jgi:hypothetical protein